MIERRPFASLGRERLDWLDTNHHFSFAHYHDPARMGWGALRVWNDDEIAAGTGFDPHPHADMEIITYVRAGAVSHEDSLGNRRRTAAGDVQVISARATAPRSATRAGCASPRSTMSSWCWSTARDRRLGEPGVGHQQCAALAPHASSSSSRAVRNRASQIVGLPVRSATARYHPAG